MSNTKEKKSGYDYSAQDNSYLDRIIIKILPGLLKITPYGLPANIITICSNTCVFLAFIIAMLSVKGIYTMWFAIPFLLIAYLLGDSLDGAQARRTKTGSQLGEYMDHFLDCFVNAELLIPIMVIYKVNNPWLLFFMLAKAYSTQASAFWERYKNGHMYFGKFSSTETVITFAIIITIGYFKSVVTFATTTLSSFEFINSLIGSTMPVLASLSVAEFILCMFVIFSLISDIATFVRTKGASYRFWSYIATVIINCVILSLTNPKMAYIELYIICFLNIDYIASLITAITQKKQDPHPDYLFTAFAVVMFVLKADVKLTLIIEFAYLCAKIIIKSALHIYKYRSYWYWKNPAPVAEAPAADK